MMEVFRDLYLHGDREQVAAVIAEVERSLTGGWTRDSVAEAGMRSFATANFVIYCLQRSAIGLGAPVFRM
jgi:hypothetical protein